MSPVCIRMSQSFLELSSVLVSALSSAGLPLVLQCEMVLGYFFFHVEQSCCYPTSEYCPS